MSPKRNVAIIGCQWGDEGKGMVVDVYAAKADMAVRFNGGNNAGHTVVVKGEKTVLHHLPSGILRPKCRCILGAGMVINPQVLLEEIDKLTSRGVRITESKLVISPKSNVIMPYHIRLDTAREAAAGSAKLGTTGRGIGPAYQDRSARTSLRFGDFVYPDALRSHLENVMPEKNFMLKNYYGVEPFSIDELFKQASRWAYRLKSFVGPAEDMVREAVEKNKRVLFEGAQATMLDVDHGTAPFVTSSNTIAGAICIGIGLPPSYIGDVIGVAKAYTTRVGAGPFPTELKDEKGDRLRNAGNEFGSTTGRPRRCGWLDLLVLHYAKALSGIGSLAITKLDVLDGFESINICTGYRLKGKMIKKVPARISEWQQVAPIYKAISGWPGTVRNCKRFQDLPREAKNFLHFIEDEMKIPITLISVGPGREETILRRKPFE